MVKIKQGEEGRNQSISIRPFKVLENFEKASTEILNLNISEMTSALMIYLIRNKKNKKLVDELKKIRREIDMHNVQLPPSF